MPTERRHRLLAAALLALTTAGCTEIEDGMAAVPFLNWMREAPFFDPYEAPRPAPPNAVPVESPAGGWEPTLPTPVTEVALRAFGDTMTNPLPMSADVLARGEAVYLTYCSVCHGPQGQGDGPIVGPGKFPMAPNLTVGATVQRTDGYIYAIVKAGRGLMPPYQRIPQRDRWAVVNYVRQLQGQGPAGATAAPRGTRTPMGEQTPPPGAGAPADTPADTTRADGTTGGGGGTEGRE